MLLLTALLIAWRASGELAGGALAGIVICTCLGALLTVLPFVLNDAREREAVLAERQRELVDLVNSTTATASRWGAQWAAAATGLEDASTLAARSIAAADRAPAALQEKIDALTVLLEQSDRATRERDVLAAQRDALAMQRYELAARRDEAVETRSVEIAGVLATLEKATADFARVDTALRERHAALAASLAEIPSAIARAQAVCEAIDERAAEAPKRISVHVERLTAEAEQRVGAVVDAAASAIALRVSELETALSSLSLQLERVQTLASASLPAAVNTLPGASAGVAEATPAVQSPAAAELPREQPVLDISVTTEAAPTSEPAVRPAAKPVNVVSKDAIMDPFYIPDNGYSALAEAMDGKLR